MDIGLPLCAFGNCLLITAINYWALNQFEITYDQPFLFTDVGSGNIY